MADLAIQVESLSKLYRIGERQDRYVTLRDTLTDVVTAPWHMLRSVFQRSDARDIRRQSHVWALKDVSFDVKSGEVIGVIGRNGAGKSTLLKILSRITEPTEGRAVIHGRVGSLLEVGTGFHPELTGRENIYFNGAILGMKKAEIDRKFDEIVAFAEVEKFLDTPVKRYSSGMHVRLGFAVAAHLDPEILLVDEVLAVGDVGFQKKCLGKLANIATAGRTVLFVSHSLEAIRRLCSRTILIAGGKIAADGQTDDTIDVYTKIIREDDDLSKQSLRDRLNRTSGAVRFSSVTAYDTDGNARWTFEPGETVRLKLTYEAVERVPNLGLYLAFRSATTGETLTSIKEVLPMTELLSGKRTAIWVEFPNVTLRPGAFALYVCLGNEDCSKFYDVVDDNVGLPQLVIRSGDTDPHRTAGYFSMPVRIYLDKSESAGDAVRN